MENREGREICEGCDRPASVCLCPYFPSSPLSLRTSILILRHPFEKKAALATVPLLKHCLVNCTILHGKSFQQKDLGDLDNGSTFLLYPGKDAEPLSVVKKTFSSSPLTIIALDGTWKTCSYIYSRSPCLHSLPKIRLSPQSPSKYVIRKEPSPQFLSTLEAVALTTSEIESNPELFDILTLPLEAMVRMQLERIQNVKHRTERKGYIPNLYSDLHLR